MAFKKSVTRGIQEEIIKDLKASLHFSNEESALVYWHTGIDNDNGPTGDNVVTAEVFDDAFPGQPGKKYDVIVMVTEHNG